MDPDRSHEICPAMLLLALTYRRATRTPCYDMLGVLTFECPDRPCVSLLVGVVRGVWQCYNLWAQLGVWVFRMFPGNVQNIPKCGTCIQRAQMPSALASSRCVDAILHVRIILLEG